MSHEVDSGNYPDVTTDTIGNSQLEHCQYKPAGNISQTVRISNDNWRKSRLTFRSEGCYNVSRWQVVGKGCRRSEYLERGKGGDA